MHTAPPGACVRSFSVQEYTPDSAFAVSLSCHVDPGAPPAFTTVVDDAYPAGWSVVPGSISDGGVEVSGTVKWFFLVEEERILTYSVLPPPFESGTKFFSGTIFADGDAGPTHMPIGGDLSIGETTMKLYWADIGAGKIQRSELDGSGMEVLVARASRSPNTVSDFRGPQGVAIHAGSAKMYWIDLDPDSPELERLQRANLNGSNIEDVITTETFGTRDLTIVFGMLYWYNLYTGEIRRANLDGTGVETVLAIFPDDDGFHVGLAADESGGRLYIALGRRIISTDMDGDAPIHVLSLGSRSRVRGIAVDEPNGMLYWADGGEDAVRRSDLDGFNIETVVDGVLNPQRIAVDPDGGKVYWTDSGPRYAATARIMRSDPDGSAAETLVTLLDLPQSIAIGPDLAPLPLPLPPTDLVASPASPFQIDLSWTDNSDDEDGFEIERAVAPDGPFVPLATAPQNPTPTAEYEDLALDPVTEYCYRVRAFNDVGKSGWSNVACATTLGLSTTPPAATTTAPPEATTTAPPEATTTAPLATTTAPVEVDVSVWGDPCDCATAPSACDPAPGRMTFQLRVATDGPGRTIPEEGTTTRPRGAMVRLTALPGPGSRFLLWRVAEPAHSFFVETPEIANSDDPSVVLPVMDDIDVTAVFIDA